MAFFGDIVEVFTNPRATAEAFRIVNADGSINKVKGAIAIGALGVTGYYLQTSADEMLFDTREQSTTTTTSTDHDGN